MLKMAPLWSKEQQRTDLKDITTNKVLVTLGFSLNFEKLSLAV